MFGLTGAQLLGFTVLAAVVTTFGNLLATFLKDYLFTRSFERWKTRQQLRQVYLKFRDPLLLSTLELTSRIIEISLESRVNFLEEKLLAIAPKRMTANSSSDLYYQRYKFVSTIYRLSGWLGWVELYRQEVAFLDSGNQKVNRDFELHLEAIRSCLADGHLNDADDWLAWEDSLIFREEQRAVGEYMIDTSKKSILGYGSFCERFITGTSESGSNWIKVVTDFLTDMRPVADQKRLDFRRARCLLLVKHGVSLVECLNEERVNKHLAEARRKAIDELSKMSIIYPAAR